MTAAEPAPDLMAALRASIEAARAGRPSAPSAAAERVTAREPIWGYADSGWSWHEMPTPCDHCGRLIKKIHTMQHRDTGRRIGVGLRCARQLVAATGEVQLWRDAEIRRRLETT